MIGLALLGILPLSGRISRRVNELTATAEQLGTGDFTVRANTRGRDEIGRLAKTFNDMAAEIELNQNRLLEQGVQQRLLEAENRRKGEELEQARAFQLSMLPRTLPDLPGLEIAVFMRTAAEVGGDYYDFHEHEDGSLTVAIGDATGHGAMAGTMVTAVKSLFSGSSDKAPAQFLEDANRAVKTMNLRRMSMAFALARLSAPDAEGARSLVIASAGMPPAVVHRHASGGSALDSGDGLEEVVLHGLPLGAMRDASYSDTSLRLSAGDCVLFMSDGLPELANAEDQAYGYERVPSVFGGELGGLSPSV